MALESISLDIISRLFDYDHKTGELRWSSESKTTNRSGGHGSLAGYINRAGYRIVMVDGRNYRAHRIGWAIHYGSWPDGVLDHINRDTQDNRIENLRCTSQLFNAQNRVAPKHNKSGHRGVSYIKSKGVWYASIMFKGKTVSLGLHADLDDAVAARRAGEERYFTVHPLTPSK